MGPQDRMLREFALATVRAGWQLQEAQSPLGRAPSSAAQEAGGNVQPVELVY